MFQIQTEPHRNFYFQDIHVDDPEVLSLLPAISYRTTALQSGQYSDDYFIKTIVDFNFQTWNMGLVSQLEPVERRSLKEL